MSGDVQPRKRKDKKRKKDELGLEEHRGTAATFGEGDVQMHSQHDHGTGGHWCAKIIFFSLLAVLVTLIGLIILENRGLSELEANAVESQYSGILDGWIEDTPDDDHHDEHTLDLKHHAHSEDVDELASDNDDEYGENDDSEELDEHDEELEHDDEDNDEEDDDGEDENDDVNEEDEDENVSKEIEGENDDGEDENDDENGEDEDDNVSKEIEGEDDDGEDENDDENGDEEDENVSKDIEGDDDDDDTQEDDAFQEQENKDDSMEAEDGQIEKINVINAENSYASPDEEDDDDDDEDIDYDRDQGEGTDDLEDDDRDATEVGDNYDDNSNEVPDNDEDGNDAQSLENDDGDENSREEENDEDDDEDHEEDHEEEADEEIEKIEKEVSDQDVIETAEPALPDVSVEKEEETSVEIVSPDEEYEVDEKVYLEVDDLDEPAVERIAPPPPGKPYAEIEEEVSTEISNDILAEEEAYEKQQEEIRQQEAQSTHMWLKLVVGGALLAATHAVIRRATAPRDTPENEQDEHNSREETPLTDRRMTLIPDESSKVIAPTQSSRPKVEEEIVQKVTSVVKAAAVQKQESEEVDEDVAADEEIEEDQEVQETKTDDKDKELYSDDDEIEVDEEVEDEEEPEEKKEAPKSILKVPDVKKQPEPEEVPDDVEIIDEEQIEEEIEEEVEDEEEISDVDDAELLSRLEAKYGRLPEPERPGPKHKDGGNSIEEDWPGEPSDAYWREQLDKAEQELRQGAYAACEERASAARLADSGRARWLRARALDQLAEVRRDNRLLGRAITAYMRLLEMNERLSDKKILEVALRTIDRIQFRGTYLNAEPVYRLLMRRFPNDVSYRNNLTISFLMANRADLASEVLKETLRLWPNDRIALAHYGFVLKTEQNKVEEAVTYFQRALEGDAGPANEPRFYYHLGDALLLLGRKDEADEVHKRGAALGHFLSPSQRSLYNVPRLKSRPWWDVETTPYANLARELEASWREILREGEAAQALYESEKEGLRERGEWSQLDLFVRGREVPGRCPRAPVTCRIVKREPAALCRRGQIKFSLLSGGSHVRAHVGPTNCRLRMHLALSNTDHTYLRVNQETRQWQVGKVLMFDDSFEHEVWHNGTRPRLVLIVDVWHPALSAHERRALPAI